MPRIDLKALRKSHRLSQQALADRLGVKQSFLSAVENGHSPLPASKRGILADMFGEDELIIFTRNEDRRQLMVTNALLNISDSELMAQLKKTFFRDDVSVEEDSNILTLRHIGTLEERIGDLWRRNDALHEKNEFLQERVNSLASQMEESTQEIYRLRELLLRNNIAF